MLTTKASTFYLHEMAKKCATDVGKRKKIIKKMLWKIYVHENLKVKSSQLRETRIFCDDRHQKHHTVKLNRKKN